MQDRGGGRESAKHDRRTKRSVTNPLKDNPFAKKDGGAGGPSLSISAAAPPLAAPRRSALSVVDCGANLTSRQLVREQARMLQRAFDGGVDAVLAFATDFDKLAELQALSAAFHGGVYCCVGMHPDNVKRSNEKDLQKRLQELRAAALAPDCVAVFCGLDFSRDFASHFPQERLLDAQLRIASELRLPAVVTVAGGAAAHERLAEKLAEWSGEFRASERGRVAGAAAAAVVGAAVNAAGVGGTAAGSAAIAAAASAAAAAVAQGPADGGPGDGGGTADGGSGEVGESGGGGSEYRQEALDALGRPYVPRAAVFAFDGEAKALQAYLDCGCSIVVTGAICDSTDASAALRALVSTVPPLKLLVASNAPLSTPQNIRDEAIRTTRNEPSNLPSVLSALVEAYTTSASPPPEILSQKDLARRLFVNACAFFGLQEPSALSAPSGGVVASLVTVAASGNAETRDEAEAGRASFRDSAGDAGADAAGVAAPAQILAVSPAALPPVSLSSSSVLYRCRTCRGGLFSDADVMPHDSSGLRASSRAVAAAAQHGGAVIAPRAIAASGPSISAAAPNDDDDGEGVGEASRRKAGGAKAKGAKGKGDKKGGASSRAVTALDDGSPESAGRGTGPDSDAATGAAADIEIGEVAVGRWREAKGRTVMALRDQGACRMLLVERAPWMALAAGEPEGSILCPGCGSKVGQYNLGGIKCSCGLTCTPAFKVPRNRVDAELVGVDALEAALLAADIKDRGGVSLLGLGGDEAGDDGGGGDEDDEGGERRRERRKKAAVSKHRGNFSEYRNQVTVTGGVKRSANKEVASGKGDGSGGALAGGLGSGVDGEDEEEA